MKDTILSKYNLKASLNNQKKMEMSFEIEFCGYKSQRKN